jgi:hypothetical protein
VKAIHADALRTLAIPLQVLGVEATTESEGNVGLSRNDELGEYVEKGSSWRVDVDQLGSLTLGDFGKFMPELLKLGLPANTMLISTKVYAVHTKPGQIIFPGAEPFPVSLEGWSKTEGGPIFLFDISYRFNGGYYTNAPSHTAGERFMTLVLQGALKEWTLPDSGRWGGSKVRDLLNHPLER